MKIARFDFMGLAANAAIRDWAMSGEMQEIKVICFRLGEDLYAADIMRVKEIVKPLKPAGLPNAPEFIDGMINLRGAVIPVLNLHKRFGISPPVSGRNARFLIVLISGQPFAILVDEVTEVITVPVKDLRPPPHVVNGMGTEHLIAVCLVKGALVMLLNIDTILHSREVEEVREMEAP